MPEHLASERPGKEGQALVNNREEESPRTGTLSSHGAASLARKFSTAPACSLGTSDPPLSPSTPPEQTHSLSEVQGPSRIGGGAVKLVPAPPVSYREVTLTESQSLFGAASRPLR